MNMLEPEYFDIEEYDRESKAARREFSEELSDYDAEEEDLARLARLGIAGVV